LGVEVKQTREVMFIYWWNVEERGHEEVPGLCIFAATLRSHEVGLAKQRIDSFLTDCKHVAGYSFMQVNSEDDPLNIVKIYIKLSDHFSEDISQGDYPKLLTDLLSLFLELDFDLVWVGVDYETDYRDLFYEGQTIYAAASRKLGVITPSDWNEELTLVDPSKVAKLRNEAVELISQESATGANRTV
jgi:hypothetical protein